jgi:hypothetical protein
LGIVETLDLRLMLNNGDHNILGSIVTFLPACRASRYMQGLLVKSERCAKFAVGGKYVFKSEEFIALAV